MKKILIILTIVLATFDYPLVVGIVTFLPFLGFAVWIARTFWPKIYVLQWRIVLQDLLRR